MPFTAYCEESFRAALFTSRMIASLHYICLFHPICFLNYRDACMLNKDNPIIVESSA